MIADNTLKFLVVAKKPRTFSSLPHSGNEQVFRSWEGAQPGRWAKLASGNIPYHGWHAQPVNGGLVRGQKLFQKFHPFSRSSAKSMTSGKPVGSAITAQGLSAELVIRW